MTFKVQQVPDRCLLEPWMYKLKRKACEIATSQRVVAAATVKPPIQQIHPLFEISRTQPWVWASELFYAWLSRSGRS